MTTISRLASFRYPTNHRGTVTLRYDTAMPYAAVLDFGMYENGQESIWTVARDLLADGLTIRASEGAVECWTDGAWFHLQLVGVNALTGEDLAGTVRLDADEVRGFLIDAEGLVPYGAELADFDVELSKLLIGGW